MDRSTLWTLSDSVACACSIFHLIAQVWTGWSPIWFWCAPSGVDMPCVTDAPVTVARGTGGVQQSALELHGSWQGSMVQPCDLNCNKQLPVATSSNLLHSNRRFMAECT
jgi:hypothetical protein